MMDFVHDQSATGRSIRVLTIVDEVHRPHVVRSRRRLAIVVQLRLDPTLGRLVPQLQSQLIVNPVRSLDVDLEALTPKHDVHAPIAVSDARLADRLDVGFEAFALRGARGLIRKLRRCFSIDIYRDPFATDGSSTEAAVHAILALQGYRFSDKGRVLLGELA